MGHFGGFPSGKTKTTPIPALFFTDLLSQIDHLGELKITLYAFWFVSQQEGRFRFITYEDFAADKLLMQGLKNESVTDKPELDEALERSVARGTLLAATDSSKSEKKRIYFINSPRGRAAVEAIQQGKWLPDFENHHQPLLEFARPNIFRLYEENIGPLTPMVTQALLEAEENFSMDWIEEAIRIAVLNNVRRWRYVEAILNSWHEKGRDGTNRRDSEKDRRKYLEGEFAEFIEH